MNPLKLFGCAVGKHKRSSRKARRYTDNSVLSTCKQCGRKMYLHPREGWKVERRSEQRCHELASGVVALRPRHSDSVIIEIKADPTETVNS